MFLKRAQERRDEAKKVKDKLQAQLDKLVSEANEVEVKLAAAKNKFDEAELKVAEAAGGVKQPEACVTEEGVNEFLATLSLPGTTLERLHNMLSSLKGNKEGKPVAMAVDSVAAGGGVGSGGPATSPSQDQSPSPGSPILPFCPGENTQLDEQLQGIVGQEGADLSGVYAAIGQARGKKKQRRSPHVATPGTEASLASAGGGPGTG